MSDHVGAFSGAIFVLVQVLFLAVALAFLAVRARGRGKRLGIAGCVVLLVSALVSLPTTVFLPAIVASFDGQFASVSLVVGVVNLVVTGLSLAGIGLLVAAVVAGSNRPDPGVSGGWGPSSGGPPPR